MTVRVEESVHIAKPPPDVWDAIADYAFDLEWRKGLSEMIPTPRGRRRRERRSMRWSETRGETTSPTRS